MNKWNDGTHFSRSFDIVYMHCDEYRRLNIASLLGMLTEAARDEDEHLGFGYDYFLKYNQTYVLSRVSLRVFSLPECGDTVTVTGWYTGVWDNRFHRDFEMKSEDGRLLATARTESALFDPVARVGLATDELLMELPNAVERKADVPECKRITVEGELPVLGEYLTRYSDMDNNWHVGYLTYARLSVDFLPEALRNRGYKDVVFNYIREAMEGETFEIRGGETQEGYVVQGFTDGKLRFLTQLTVDS